MIRFLLRVAVFLGSSAIGLLVAAWLIPGVSVSPLGFITAVVIFTVAQAILSPFFLKMASRYASAFLGGIGLVSTLAALILASLLSNGLSIRGIGSWIAATVVVWLVTALATLVLPALVLRTKKNAASLRASGGPRFRRRRPVAQPPSMRRAPSSFCSSSNAASSGSRR